MGDIIGIAADHGGRELKKKVRGYLTHLGLDVRDFGVDENQSTSVDYPDYAQVLAAAVGNGDIPKGILICGTGIGMSIAANKMPNIRAAVVWDEYTTRMSKLHNNANILCLGDRTLNHERAIDLVRVWLETPFEGKRHQTRIDKIKAIEDSFMKKK